MSAHAAGVSGGKFKGGAVTVTGTGNKVTINNGDTYSGSGGDGGGGDDDGEDDKKNFSYEVFDYVEVRLKYFADQTKKIADKITDYISSATKKTSLFKQIRALQKEIEVNSHAATTYMDKANTIMHNYVYTDDDGNATSIDMTNVFDPHDLVEGKYVLEDYETTTAEQKAYVEAARAYMDYYNKANDATNAITDLTNTMRELYDSIIQLPTEKLDKTVEKIENVLDTFNNGMDAIASGQSGVNTLQNILQPYTALFSKKDRNGKEISTLGKVLDSRRNEPAWHAQNALLLQSVKKQQEEVSAAQTALQEQKELTKEIAAIEYDRRHLLEKLGQDLLNSGLLNQDQRDAIKNKYMIDPIYVPAELAEAVANYNEVVKSWQSETNSLNQAREAEVQAEQTFYQTAAEAAKSVQDYVKEALENLDNYYQSLIEYNKSLADTAAKERELVQTVGRNRASGDKWDLEAPKDLYKNYRTQMVRLFNVRQGQEEDAKKMQEFINKKISDGEIINGSEEWREYTTKVTELRNQAIETQIEIEKLQDEMVQEIYFKPLEEAIEKVKTLRENVSSLQQLITDDMKFTKQGDYTVWGIAHITADANALNLARDEITRVKQEYDALNAAYQNGSISAEDYLKRSNDLNKSMQDAVKAADSARRSMIKTIQDRYQTEIEYINKLIDARKKEIQKAKERFQYDKSLKKSTKEIQLIQQQIRALDTLILYWRFYINCGKSPITPIRYNVIGNDKRECGMCLKHQKP